MLVGWYCTWNGFVRMLDLNQEGYLFVVECTYRNDTVRSASGWAWVSWSSEWQLNNIWRWKCPFSIEEDTNVNGSMQTVASTCVVSLSLAIAPSRYSAISLIKSLLEVGTINGSRGWQNAAPLMQILFHISYSQAQWIPISVWICHKNHGRCKLSRLSGGGCSQSDRSIHVAHEVSVLGGGGKF